MIVGLGVDLCEVRRLEELVGRYGDRVLERLFTHQERERCRSRRGFECLAGRFAAKEAALKALGTGLSQGIAWRDVELVGKEAQPPSIDFHRKAREIFEYRGADSVHVSVSHDGGFAVAVVVLERKG